MNLNSSHPYLEVLLACLPLGLVVDVAGHAEVVPGAVGVPRRGRVGRPRHLEAAILVKSFDRPVGRRNPLDMWKPLCTGPGINLCEWFGEICY